MLPLPLIFDVPLKKTGNNTIKTALDLLDTAITTRFEAKCNTRYQQVFSVTPFKIDQNKNQNRSIDKVQNLGNERRYIYKDPRQDSGQRNISYTRYPKKCFTQIYRDLCGDAMLLPIRMGTRFLTARRHF